MHRSFRSPLTAMIREAGAVCREARRTGAPIDEVGAMRAGRMARPARRTVLSGAASVAAAALLPTRTLAVGQPRVAIVGGGLAGLQCAYRLWRQAGIIARIFEWNDRVGGRVETLRDYFANDQITEQHGEFISSEHSATLGLAHELGLTLWNTDAYPKHEQDTYRFQRERYTQADLNADWQSFGWKLFRHAVEHAPHANYQSYSRTAYVWDHMSVTEWVDRHVPGGAASRFGRLCLSNAISEYGGPPDKQSALNLIYVLGYDTSARNERQSTHHPLLAGTDEKWHIRGGNDQLASGLAAGLPDGAIRLDHRLVALRENSDSSFSCTFRHGQGTVEFEADHVVLAIPFTMLREVDLERVHFSALKRRAIENLQLGNNVKIQIQVAGSPWSHDGYTGDMLSGGAPQGGWDASFYQEAKKPGATEIYVALPGGREGIDLAAKYGMKFGHYQGPAPADLVTDTLSQLEQIFSGITNAWQQGPQLAWVNNGNLDPRLRGAWSQYNVGQFTGFSGIEKLAEGNIHFAGEHTSLEFQGYIEGAVRSGARAAREILGT
ncbi:MAG TPA: NAD(P)/FAD-dependent oxidoreductase [Rhizomicrobium sp.]|nr:NAD(P)/FAD-dependent oxidoreductase [Rhizomicrobium sp.]